MQVYFFSNHTLLFQLQRDFLGLAITTNNAAAWTSTSWDDVNSSGCIFASDKKRTSLQYWPYMTRKKFVTCFMFHCKLALHSLIRGVLIQSWPTGAKNFINYLFCHPQFSGVIQNIENRCAILTPICLCRLLLK